MDADELGCEQVQTPVEVVLVHTDATRQRGHQQGRVVAVFGRGIHGYELGRRDAFLPGEQRQDGRLAGQQTGPCVAEERLHKGPLHKVRGVVERESAHLGAPATGQEAQVGDRAAVDELLGHPLAGGRPATVVEAGQHGLHEVPPVVAVVTEPHSQLVLCVRKVEPRVLGARGQRVLYGLGHRGRDHRVGARHGEHSPSLVRLQHLKRGCLPPAVRPPDNTAEPAVPVSEGHLPRLGRIHGGRAQPQRRHPIPVVPNEVRHCLPAHAEPHQDQRPVRPRVRVDHRDGLLEPSQQA